MLFERHGFTGCGKIRVSDWFPRSPQLVLRRGESVEPKILEAAAPIPQFTYNVTLRPDITEYDVRQREFGSAEPHSFGKQEIESYVLELRTTVPQWYEFQLVTRRYNAGIPTGLRRFGVKYNGLNFGRRSSS